MSVDQIAMLAGFDSPVTFRARFRRVVGLTPTEYRRRFSSPEEFSEGFEKLLVSEAGT